MTKLRTEIKTPRAIYFALVLASIGLAIVLVINFLYLQVFIERSEENVFTLQVIQGRRISYIVENFVSHKIESLEGLANTLNLASGETYDKGKIIQSFLKKHPGTTFISVFNVAGEELERVSSENYQTDRGLSSCKTFYHAMGREVYISETFFLEDGEAYIRLGIPIFNEEKNEMEGVLISGLSLKEVCELIFEIRIAATSRTSIVDNKGNLIADVDPSRVLERINLIGLAPVRATMNGLIKEEEYLNEKGESVVGVGVPIKELGWGVIIEQNSEEFRKIEKDTQFLTSLFTGVGLILIIVISWSILTLINTDKAMRRYQSQLTKSEERFRDIVQSSSDWIWETNRNGKYIFVSAGVKNILGYKSKELIGKTRFDLMSKREASKIKKIFEECVSKNKPIRDLENWNITKDGKEICMLTNGVPVLDSKDRLVGYRGVDKDITVEKRTKEDLKRRVKERTAELDQKLIELQKWRKLTVGRELKMVELKEKIKEQERESKNLKEKDKKK